jgi:hypothetical protein
MDSVSALADSAGGPSEPLKRNCPFQLLGHFPAGAKVVGATQSALQTCN